MKLSSKKSITLMKLKAAPPKPLLMMYRRHLNFIHVIKICSNIHHHWLVISISSNFIQVKFHPPFDVALFKRETFGNYNIRCKKSERYAILVTKKIHCQIWRLGFRISIHCVPLWATSSNLQKHIRARNEKDTVIRSQKTHCLVCELY